MSRSRKYLCKYNGVSRREGGGGVQGIMIPLFGNLIVQKYLNLLHDTQNFLGWPNVGLMVARRLRCRPTINPTLGQRLVVPRTTFLLAIVTAPPNAAQKKRWTLLFIIAGATLQAAPRREMKAGKSLSFTAPRFLTRGAARRGAAFGGAAR